MGGRTRLLVRTNDREDVIEYLGDQTKDSASAGGPLGREGIVEYREPEDDIFDIIIFGYMQDGVAIDLLGKIDFDAALVVNSSNTTDMAEGWAYDGSKDELEAVKHQSVPEGEIDEFEISYSGLSLDGGVSGDGEVKRAEDINI